MTTTPTTVACPACTRWVPAALADGRPVAGQRCSSCQAPLDAARADAAQQPAWEKLRCSGCGEWWRLPPRNVGAFIARGRKCLLCAAAAPTAAAREKFSRARLRELLAAAQAAPDVAAAARAVRAMVTYLEATL